MVLVLVLVGFGRVRVGVGLGRVRVRVRVRVGVRVGVGVGVGGTGTGYENPGIIADFNFQTSSKDNIRRQNRGSDFTIGSDCDNPTTVTTRRL